VRRSIRARLGLATAALVAGCATLAIGAVYWATASAVRHDSEVAVRGELDSLLGTWRGGGLDALVGEVGRRAGDPTSQGFAYLITQERSLRIAGNVRAWPQEIPDEARAGPVLLEVQRADVWRMRSYRLESVRLDGRRSLLVGSDASAEAPLLAVLQMTALGGLVFSLLLAIGAGLTVSRRLLGRIEDMRATIVSILGGRKEGRVAVSAAGDEFDELASHFNRLLA